MSGKLPDAIGVGGQARFTARDSCPACHESRARALYQAPYTRPPLSTYLLSFYGRPAAEAMLGELEGIDYVLLECEVCGLVYQRDVPRDDFVETLYERWIDPAESLGRRRAERVELYAVLAQEILQVLSALGRPPSTLRVLDFGMGWATWPLMARGFGCEAYGSELSRERVDHAESVGIPNVEWDEIPEYRFDFINTEQVFEHLVDPYETLAHLKRALAPDGLLKVSVPNGTDIHRRLRKMDWEAPKFTRNSLNAVAPLEHLNCFAAPSLRALGRRAGLEPVYLPLRIYYRYTLPWELSASFARQLVKPVYRSVMKRGSYMFFAHAKG
jgi:SAM-dependent methyltransferase